VRKQTLLLVTPVVLVLTILLGSGPSLAQGPDSSQPQAGLGPAFTYQGQLKDGAGNPITTTCDFLFSLWDALSAGTQVGGNSTVTGVAVANGFFAALVNAGGEFGANAFTGEARWLEIAVQCSGDPGYTTLSPRQELSGAPYALSLRPGAKVVGSVSGGAAILGQNTAANGTGVYGMGPNAVVADSSSPGYGAMVGRNYATTGAGYGVYGLTASAEANTAGLYGWANAASGQTYGAYARSDSPDGSGVYGEATATSGAAKGVVGRTAAPGVSGTFTYYSMGVDGYATSTSGPTAGVWGQSASTEGIGVRGWASANDGRTYGLYGQSDSTLGTGVYGSGAIGVEGESTRSTGSGVVGVGFIGVRGQSHSTLGSAVYGEADATSGSAIGVQGWSASIGGAGVSGWASANSGQTRGVDGVAASSDGYGVAGHNSAGSGNAFGIYGRSDSTDGTAVYGWTSPTSGTTYGVQGLSRSPSGYGVYGTNIATSGTAYGVYGLSHSTEGSGMYGLADASSGITYGVQGQSDSSVGKGVAGFATATSGATYGVYGESRSVSGFGVYAHNTASSGPAYGVYAVSDSTEGYGVFAVGRTAVAGLSPSGDGVAGTALSTDGRGVYGTGPGFGVYGLSTNGAGVYGEGLNGVVGRSSTSLAAAVYGQNTATSGITYGVYGTADSPDSWSGYFRTVAGNGVYISTPAGRIGLTVVSGTKNAAVHTDSGSRLLYTEESAEVWFTDYGFGQLHEGAATVAIDPLFAQTVNLASPYHVFLQAYGGADVYVSNRTATSFEVHSWAGDANVEFSYRIVARRLGYEDERLRPAPWADQDPNLYPEKAAALPGGEP
jgi:hypothetical protein